MNACSWMGCGADDVFCGGPGYVGIMVRSGSALWQAVVVILWSGAEGWCRHSPRQRG